MSKSGNRKQGRILGIKKELVPWIYKSICKITFIFQKFTIFRDQKLFTLKKGEVSDLSFLPHIYIFR